MKSDSLTWHVVGVGNEYRQDDGVGLWVVRQMAKLDLPNVQLTELHDCLDLLESWQTDQSVVVVDAVVSSSLPGTLHAIDAIAASIPTPFSSFSSHTFSLADAVQLAKNLDRLPRQLWIYGIEAQKHQMGIGLSKSVQKTALSLVKTIQHQIAF